MSRIIFVVLEDADDGFSTEPVEAHPTASLALKATRRLKQNHPDRRYSYASITFHEDDEEPQP